MTITELKEELQEVKYYYGHKAMFDRALSTVSKNKVLEKVARYNDLVQDAPAQLFGLYVAIYTENNTQLAVACRMRRRSSSDCMSLYTRRTTRSLPSRWIGGFRKGMSRT